MARNFLSTVNQISRGIDQMSRATARSEREAQRQQRIYEKEERKYYIESRIEEAEQENAALALEIEHLSTLLISIIGKKTKFDFDSLLVTPKLPVLDLGSLSIFPPQPRLENHLPSKAYKFFYWIPGIKKLHNALTIKAQQKFELLMQGHTKTITAQQVIIEQKRIEHENLIKPICDKVERHNAEVNELKTEFLARKTGAIVQYFQLVLANSKYPENFPQQAQIIYLAESKQLLVEYDLPKIDDIIPTIKMYKYIKASDSITETPRPDNQRKLLYSSAIAQTILRCLYELFQADEQNNIETILINGYVEAIDKSTGQLVRPCIVTVRTTKDELNGIDLSQVEPTACLHRLHASVSKNPAELAPVRPILELNMVDPRFIEESDILSTLDQRPNLMELSPPEFESLITNLFQKMGLETKLTQASRDGGVDCVAFDPRPIFGGKVVIQAKRYKNTVGVSAVRDLFGTMQNEGASKGILVTTSGYGKASYDFANGKPIELLSGGNLIYLLKEHTLMDAKIIMPDDLKNGF